MHNIRDIKRKARRDLHKAMSVPSLYVWKANEPKLLHVRDHTKFDVNRIEGARGTGQLVGQQEAVPSIVFMRDEIAAQAVTLLKGGVISIERGEAYRLDNAEPPDDITVRWFVSQITDEAELASLPVPGLL